MYDLVCLVDPTTCVLYDLECLVDPNTGVLYDLECLVDPTICVLYDLEGLVDPLFGPLHHGVLHIVALRVHLPNNNNISTVLQPVGMSAITKRFVIMKTLICCVINNFHPLGMPAMSKSFVFIKPFKRYVLN